MWWFLLDVPAWAQPKPYLSAEVVEATILAEKQRFSSCSLDDGLYEVHFSIDSLGHASVLQGPSCFSSCSAIAFPSHPSSKRTFVWTVASKEKTLYPQQLRREPPEEWLIPGIFSTEKSDILTTIGEKNP